MVTESEFASYLESKFERTNKEAELSAIDEKLHIQFGETLFDMSDPIEVGQKKASFLHNPINWKSRESVDMYNELNKKTFSNCSGVIKIDEKELEVKVVKIWAVRITEAVLDEDGSEIPQVRVAFQINVSADQRKLLSGGFALTSEYLKSIPFYISRLEMQDTYIVGEDSDMIKAFDNYYNLLLECQNERS